MYHAPSVQGVDERMINVHYYYYYLLCSCNATVFRVLINSLVCRLSVKSRLNLFPEVSCLINSCSSTLTYVCKRGQIERRGEWEVEEGGGGGWETLP